jgi:hypothetical protein
MNLGSPAFRTQAEEVRPPAILARDQLVPAHGAAGHVEVVASAAAGFTRKDDPPFRLDRVALLPEVVRAANHGMVLSVLMIPSY